MITGIWVEKIENDDEVQVVVTKKELLEYQRKIESLIKENKDLREIIRKYELAVNYMYKGAN